MGNKGEFVRETKKILHLLHDFLLNPKISLEFLHGKSGNLHSAATPTTQECRQLNVEHTQAEAALKTIYFSPIKSSKREREREICCTKARIKVCIFMKDAYGSY